MSHSFCVISMVHFVAGRQLGCGVLEVGHWSVDSCWWCCQMLRWCCCCFVWRRWKTSNDRQRFYVECQLATGRLATAVLLDNTGGGQRGRRNIELEPIEHHRAKRRGVVRTMSDCEDRLPAGNDAVEIRVSTRWHLSILRPNGAWH